MNSYTHAAQQLMTELDSARETIKRLTTEGELLREIYESAKAEIVARGPESVNGAISGIGLNNAKQRVREAIMRYELAVSGRRGSDNE